MTVKTQYAIWINRIATRKRNPAKGATLSAYRSYWKNWIKPEIGRLDISKVENGVMKGLISKMANNRLAPATIAGVTSCVKEIISSVVDENGNELYPRKWNSEFLDAPIIDPREQKAPTIGRETLQEAISRTQGQFRTLCILLAGTGLRISEALALKIGNQLESSFWDSKESKLMIQKALWRGREQSTKTAAGIREVDLMPELNRYLMSNIPHIEGSLFQNRDGKAMRIQTIYQMAKNADVPGFHALRRFRVTHLRSCKIPEDIIKFWIGHSNNKDITDRYSKMAQNIEDRKKYAIEAGLGFELPKGITNEKTTS